jgi:hypothetical protein
MLALLVEDLDAAVGAVGDEDTAGIINGDGVERAELARSVAGLAPGSDVFSVTGKLDDAIIAVVGVAVGDEDVAVGECDDVGGGDEMVGAAAGFAGGAKSSKKKSKNEPQISTLRTRI